MFLYFVFSLLILVFEGRICLGLIFFVRSRDRGYVFRVLDGLI